MREAWTWSSIIVGLVVLGLLAGCTCAIVAQAHWVPSAREWVDSPPPNATTFTGRICCDTFIGL